MPSAQRLLRNFYRDSITLMQFSKGLSEQPGVRQASAVMATPGNLSLLVEAGLLAESLPSSPNDLLLVLAGDETAELEAVLDGAVAALNRRPAETQGDGVRRTPPRSLGMGLQVMPEANLVLIATPGAYAASEALKALHYGRHVMIFSDNVSLEDEIMLKQLARERGLLVMGPDCGTAIVNGIPLGFANVVRRGPIGVIGASGTGTQQVTCLIDRWGGGVSHALGLGSHDLHQKVGGLSMLTALDALSDDPATRVIVLISKPPAPEVARLILDKAAALPKPVVVDFLGADPASIARPGLLAAKTLEHAAALAVALAAGEAPPDDTGSLCAATAALAGAAAGRLAPGQRCVRGLFSGGTFCFETLLLLSPALGPLFSNTPLRPEDRLTNVWHSQAHTVIDLGDDVFTQGRPHPMIDFRLRADRLVSEARDPSVALILFDVVLGYGAHADPAGELIPAINQARAEASGPPVVFVASVCGTEADPQNLFRQEAALREAGVLLCDSNAQAARLAAAIITTVEERA